MPRRCLRMWRRTVLCVPPVCIANSEIILLQLISSKRHTLHCFFIYGWAARPRDISHTVTFTVENFEPTCHSSEVNPDFTHASRRPWKYWRTVCPLAHSNFKHVLCSYFKNIFSALRYNELFCSIDRHLKNGWVRPVTVQACDVWGESVFWVRQVCDVSVV